MAGAAVPGALRGIFYRVSDRTAGVGTDSQRAIRRKRLGPGQLHQNLQLQILFAGDPAQPGDQLLVQPVRHRDRHIGQLLSAQGGLAAAQFCERVRQHDQQLFRRAAGLCVHHFAGLQRQHHDHAQTGGDHSGLQPVFQNRPDHPVHLLPDSPRGSAALPGL